MIENRVEFLGVSVPRAVALMAFPMAAVLIGTSWALMIAGLGAVVCWRAFRHPDNALGQRVDRLFALLL